MISDEAGYIQVHGLPYVYVNKGKAPEGESAKYLTDEIAEQLLEENPDRASVIVKNPNYDPGSAKAAAKPATTSAKAPAKASKPATKPKASKPAETSAATVTETLPKADKATTDSQKDQTDTNV